MSNQSDQTIEERLYELLPCVGCGVDADPADGFGTCTCGNEKLRNDLQKLLESEVEQRVKKAEDRIINIASQGKPLVIKKSVVCPVCKEMQAHLEPNNKEEV